MISDPEVATQRATEIGVEYARLRLNLSMLSAAFGATRSARAAVAELGYWTLNEIGRTTPGYDWKIDNHLTTSWAAIGKTADTIRRCLEIGMPEGEPLCWAEIEGGRVVIIETRPERAEAYVVSYSGKARIMVGHVDQMGGKPYAAVNRTGEAWAKAHESIHSRPLPLKSANAASFGAAWKSLKRIMEGYIGTKSDWREGAPTEADSQF